MKNLLDGKIDKLIVIGGDGSLTGADLLRSEWSEHVEALQTDGLVPPDSLSSHPHLMIVGLVGSIDNDMCGTEITIGANSSLHRITEAIDSIRTTASSHTRAFIIEVMGRHCGWLALNAALAVGADWLLIPENPPPSGWEAAMCRMIQRNREMGKRATIVIIAEGAVDQHNQPITAGHVKTVLTEHMHLDSRITTLGHVQRGGTPSAYDRYLGTLQGVKAVRCLLSADPSDCPSLLVVQRENRIGVELLKECVERTRSIDAAMKELNFDQVFSLRDPEFINSYCLLHSLRAHCEETTHANSNHRLTIGIVNCGAPCGGMNAAVWGIVYYCLSRGHRVLGIGNGFIMDDVRELRWADVEGWLWKGGSELGTNRLQPDPVKVSQVIAANGMDGLICIGGFEMFTALLALENSGQITVPMLGIPATISNNVPGTDYSIGSDTALNVILNACDAIKQSASSSRKRVFVVEVQGGRCGYLATVAGLGCGATYSYIPEEGLCLKDLQRDISHFRKRFKDDKRQGRLILKNESVASNCYSTEQISNIFEAESGGEFDSRWTILGHLQQGTLPSPLDRIRAIRLAVLCMKRLEAHYQYSGAGKGLCEMIGIRGPPQVTFTPIDILVDSANIESRTCKDPWWLELRPVVRMLAKYGPLPGDHDGTVC